MPGSPDVGCGRVINMAAPVSRSISATPMDVQSSVFVLALNFAEITLICALQVLGKRSRTPHVIAEGIELLEVISRERAM
ncbi:hypothetical protein JTE90_002540 [Oedothorax gibbosus]|uniref:Uncharacterized protein n=1 Tax=Oedothorax gibbosus TaxID=931172 RepID=A0AAV6V4U1_9ARAC|nr:hypothetical protein JTE90_002540 [Oedothorax gibbosus]